MFFTGQPVFSQLLNLIPEPMVRRLSKEMNADRYCKRFTSYDHVVTMLYAGFFQCTSLRELTTGLQANASRLNHLGLKHTPRRSTVSDANKRRDALFFERLYHQLYRHYFGLPDSRKKEQRLFIIDSTTISLFTSIMQGAGGYAANGKKKGGAKAHMMIDAQHDLPAFIDITEAKEHDLSFLHKVQVPDNSIVVMDKAYVNHNRFSEWDKRGIRWVTRLKNKAVVHHICELQTDEASSSKGVISDRIVRLGRPSNQKKSPMIYARLIAFFDAQKNRGFDFITNDTSRRPEEIAMLYKRRWQIELLFKRIKQRYPLKYFLGDNPNAVKIQIWTALICDLLVRIVQKQVNRIRSKKWAYASISAMIRHHLMTYLHLLDFLSNPEKALKLYKPPESQLYLPI